MTKKKPVKNEVEEIVDDSMPDNDDERDADPDEGSGDDEIETVEPEVPTGSDVFGDVDGLPVEGRTYHIYRERGDGRQEYISEVVAPFGINDIKTRYGGGRYHIYLRTGGTTKIAKRKTVLVAGESRTFADGSSPATVGSPIVVQSTGDRLDDAIRLIKVMNEINEGKKSDGEGLADTMKSVTGAIAEMNKTMIEMMTANIRIMSETQKEKNGSTLLDVLNTTVGEVGAIVERVLEAKNPLRRTVAIPARSSAPISPAGASTGKVEPQVNAEEKPEGQGMSANEAQIAGVNIVTMLNEGQIDAGPFDFYVSFILKYYGNLVPAIKTTEFSTIVGQLQLYGLVLTNEEWLRGLFGAILASK